MEKISQEEFEKDFLRHLERIKLDEKFNKEDFKKLFKEITSLNNIKEKEEMYKLILNFFRKRL